jgi:hypothetical protein
MPNNINNNVYNIKEIFNKSPNIKIISDDIHNLVGFFTAYHKEVKSHFKQSKNN